MAAVPKVVVDGTGTYSVGEHIFEPGVTPCEHTPTLDAAASCGLDWVRVEGHEASPSGEGSQLEESASPEEAAPPAPSAEPAQPALATAAEVEDQKESGTEFDGEIAKANALTSKEAFKAPLGEEPPDEPKPEVDGHPCIECERVFKSKAGLVAHLRAHKE